MPKHYTMGGRAAQAASSAQGTTPEPRSLRERVGALRNLPPFVRLVWQTSPLLAVGECVLRLARALLPVATLYVGKLIIDDVVRLAQMTGRPTTLPEWLESGQFDRMIMLILTEFALAVVADIIGRIVMLVDSLLSDRLTNESSVNLMEHARSRRPDGLRALADRPSAGGAGAGVPG